MTDPFNPLDRDTFAAGRANSVLHRALTPGLTLAVIAAATALAAATGWPVMADASGDGTGVNRPGQPPAETRAATPTAPLRCEIALEAVHGGTEITGMVRSDAAPVTGEYSLAITSRSAGGRATIRQSGTFEAAPGAPAIVGQTRLMGDPASQDVDMAVTVEGARLPCAANL